MTFAYRTPSDFEIWTIFGIYSENLILASCSGNVAYPFFSVMSTAAHELPSFVELTKWLTRQDYVV